MTGSLRLPCFTFDPVCVIETQGGAVAIAWLLQCCPTCIMSSPAGRIMLAHACTRELEADPLRSPLAIQQVQGQPEQYETLCQTTKTETAGVGV